MSVFDLDTEGAAQLEEQARGAGITADEVQPGFFDNAGYATGMGLARGAAKAGRAGALAIGAGLTLAEKAGGYEPGSVTGSYFDSVVDKTDEAVEFFTPNANEVGTAGRVLGTLAEIVAPLAAGAGNPSLLIGSTGLNTTFDLAKKGADPATAVGVGLVDATAVGIGFRLPFLGSTFAQKAATGAGANLVLGTVATAADRTILDARGYEELASQYNPLDIEARTVDLLTGIAFGGIAQLQTRGAREIARSDREAALAALNAKHYQNDTAPGRPADERALVAHQDAIETALRQLQEGRPVEVGETGVTEARFLEAPRETGARDPEVRALLEELGIRDTLEAPQDPTAPRPEAVVDTPAALGEAPRGDVEPGKTVTPAEAEPVSQPAPRAEPAKSREPAREPDDPDVIAAERSVEESDIQIDTGVRDADDAAVTASARDSLAAARQEVATAQREATAFEAAVACALSFGGA